MIFISMAPKQKPGRSKQDYCTPPEFLEALKRRLHITEFEIDLATSDENHVAQMWITEQNNSLIQNWGPPYVKGWGFCNPPFAHIRPWVEKAATESANGALIAMLVPAGVGANWWRDYVDGLAHVLFLNGRLTFVGETAPYPKDCAILLWTPFIYGGYEIWNWRTE
jgi:DNA (cytosine-5)-methyltransferase 1